MVIAVIEAASAAGAAVQDLDARLPSVVIRREISEDPVQPYNRNQRSAEQARPRLVLCDSGHARDTCAAVTGILNQYGPLEFEELSDSAPT